MQRSFALFAACALTLLAASPAEARFFRSDQVPHGGDFDCSLCHVDMGGGGELNAFGTQIFDNGLDAQTGTGNVLWANICMMDADGDGYTNGEELGDTNCTWTVGMADPPLTPSHPGDADADACGNGVVDGPEDCDGTQLDGADCASEGEPAGPLSCNRNCTFNTSLCTGASANNTNGGTNNTNGGTNNTNGNNTNGGTNNANVNNTPGPDPDPTPTDDGADSDDVGMACDGTLDVDQGEGESAMVVFALLALVGFRRRTF